MLFYGILIISFGILLGHFIYGLKYYMPKTDGENQVIKDTTKAVFHYVSVLYIIYIIYLLGNLFGAWQIDSSMKLFLGIWFLGCGAVNLFYGIKAGIFKIFQWLFFFPLGIMLIFWSKII